MSTTWVQISPSFYGLTNSDLEVHLAHHRSGPAAIEASYARRRQRVRRHDSATGSRVTDDDDSGTSSGAAVCRTRCLDHAAAAHRLSSGTLRRLQHHVRALYAPYSALSGSAS